MIKTLLFSVCLSSCVIVSANDAVTLPGTDPLTIEGDLPDLLMDGAHAFIERKIDASIETRKRLWKRDRSSVESYVRSVEPNRQRLARILGVVDPRVAPGMEHFGDADNPSHICDTDRFRVHQVRWPVLENVSRVTGEGLLLRPIDRRPRGHVIAIPDAVWLPEDIAGLTSALPEESQYARRLAENGFQVIVPTLIDRDTTFSGNPRLGNRTNKPHREWIYHSAFQMGRHVIGYEVQRVLAVVDWVREHYGEKAKIGVVGRGEGGLIAFYAAALDKRIRSALVSAYFDSRQAVWKEPIYRNVWSLLHEFGDAEIATLIVPRGLVIEHADAAELHFKRSETRPGEIASHDRHKAGGEIHTPDFESLREEFERIDGLVPVGFQKRHLVDGGRGRRVAVGSTEALSKFTEFMGAGSDMAGSGRDPVSRRRSFDPVARQGRQVKELENHVQWLLRNADHTRDAFFLKRVNLEKLDAFVADVEKNRYRDILWEEVLGKIDDPLVAVNPRSRKVYDREKWTGYEVVLDVLPELIAYGILLLPKDLRPGEKRPVVVCQHGRNGIPRNVIEGDAGAYHDYAARLADRGFVVFAPHNLYRKEQRYRWLDRKANGVKLSMFSLIISQHLQILNWLEKLPFVDPKQIAFYGLSYGGETAVRVPPLLDRYCLSICSADFNDWARRVADTHSGYGYPFHNEWEMPYFNMGLTFNYAELAYLMVPRPFMVERGHFDGVGPDEWVAYEFAKVRRLYAQLGIGDRAEIEFFLGPHTINGKGTFEFLERHLNWEK